MLRRRGLLGLLGAALVAPAVVKASGMMPVRSLRDVPPKLWGDGIHDDTAALQWLVDQAAPSGVVRLPFGRFRLTDTLHVPEQVFAFSGNHSTLLGQQVRGAALHFHREERLAIQDVSVHSGSGSAIWVGMERGRFSTVGLP